jgi:hypothetical protein
MTKIFGLALLVATLSTPASAAVDQFLFFPDHGSRGFSAPEIDPASALSAMTMLGAGLMIVRGRRSKK